MTLESSTDAAEVALLDTRKAAAALGISPRTIWQLTQDGHLTCVRIGRRVLYDPADVRTFIEQRKGANQ